MPELIGARTLRVEDPRLVTGRGHYVDDIQLPGMLHAAFVRSNLAHGRIRSIDVSAARDAPGSCWPCSSSDFDGMVGMLVPLGPPRVRRPPFPVLANDKVRCTGEPLAMSSPRAAPSQKTRASSSTSTSSLLGAVSSIDDALDPAAPLLLRGARHQRAVHRRAHLRRSRRRVRPGRPRGRRAFHAGADGQRAARGPRRARRLPRRDRRRSTIDVAHQNPHALRLSVAGAALDHPADLVTVRCGDIGGSFGQKAYTSREEIAVAAAARAAGAPGEVDRGPRARTSSPPATRATT